MTALRLMLPDWPGAGLAASAIAAMVVAAAPAEAARPMEARAAEQRIEPIYDLPNAPPYRRDGRDLDLGYLYAVPRDGIVTKAAYRRGHYVLYTGDRYLAIGDRTLLLIEQNLGEDPLARHHAHRIAGEPAPEAAPAALARADAAPAAKSTRVDIPPPAEDASEEKPEATASPGWTVDNRTLGAATALILLVVAAFRLAGAVRAKGRGRRTRGDGRSGTSHIGGSRNRLATRLDSL